MSLRSVICLLLVVCFVAPRLSAQNAIETDRRYYAFSAGVGASWGTAVILTRLSQGGIFSQVQARKVASTPVYGASFERRFNKRWGFGAAFSYQSYQLIFMDFDPRFRQLVGSNIDQYDRFNYAIRGLLFMGKNKKLDMYWALRLGYTDWQHFSTSGDRVYLDSKEIKDSFSFQLAYGMRYFMGVFGFGYEVGLGTAPYLVMANVCLKFAE